MLALALRGCKIAQCSLLMYGGIAHIGMVDSDSPLDECTPDTAQPVAGLQGPALQPHTTLAQPALTPKPASLQMQGLPQVALTVLSGAEAAPPQAAASFRKPA